MPLAFRRRNNFEKFVLRVKFQSPAVRALCRAGMARRSKVNGQQLQGGRNDDSINRVMKAISNFVLLERLLFLCAVATR
jgi:hypothetical protein